MTAPWAESGAGLTSGIKVGGQGWAMMGASSYELTATPEELVMGKSLEPPWETEPRSSRK